MAALDPAVRPIRSQTKMSPRNPSTKAMPFAGRAVRLGPSDRPAGQAARICSISAEALLDLADADPDARVDIALVQNAGRRRSA